MMRLNFMKKLNRMYVL